MRVLLFSILLGCSTSAPRVASECLIGGEAPQSISDAIDRINSLPQPVTLPCFLASLPRPLDVVSVNSVFSAQPAPDADHPRVFILTEGLVMSVVLGGEGAHLLEFGEWESTTRTIKGELPFPVARPLVEEDAFDVLYSDSLTTCALCHGNEQPVDGRPGAYASDALGPNYRQVGSVDRLRNLNERCNHRADPDACLMLHALFDFGEMRETEFSDELDTF